MHKSTGELSIRCVHSTGKSLHRAWPRFGVARVQISAFVASLCQLLSMAGTASVTFMQTVQYLRNVPHSHILIFLLPFSYSRFLTLLSTHAARLLRHPGYTDTHAWPRFTIFFLVALVVLRWMSFHFKPLAWHFISVQIRDPNSRNRWARVAVRLVCEGLSVQLALPKSRSLIVRQYDWSHNKLFDEHFML